MPLAKDSDSSTDDESDDDVDIQIDHGWSNHAAENIKSQILEEDRSTHFIAIKITVPDIINKALEIQKHIVKKEEVRYCV